MSYDIYCYRPTRASPNVKDADVALDSEQEEGRVETREAADRKQRIVAALVQQNSRLEPFQLDYEKIAEFEDCSIEDAKARWNHIELNPPEGDIAIQLTVHGGYVHISIPYWYEGERADRMFSELSAYLRVIKKTAGFFAYDPQTHTAFDPDVCAFENRAKYERIVKMLPGIVADSMGRNKKPWWRFW
jgi:hypothetical protein